MRRYIPSIIVCVGMIAVLRILHLFDFPYQEIIYSFVSIALFVLGGFILKIFMPDMRMGKFFGIRGVHNRVGGLIFWLTVLVVSGSMVLNYVTSIVFSLLGKNVSANSFAAVGQSELWLNLLYVAIIPSIFEELFFRGAVLTSFNANGKHRISALIVSSLLFALVHGSYYYVVTNMFAGIVFGIAAYMTGSVYMAMIVHFLNNALSYFIYLYGNKLEDTDFGELIVYIIGLIFLIALYKVLGKVYKFRVQEKKNKRPIANEGDIIWEQEKEKHKSKKSPN